MAAISTIPATTADIVHPSDLSAADIAAWRRLQAATPEFGSPLLGVEFAQAVGAVREDARVAIYRQDGETVGFLAHHRRPGGFARAIGAPFSDYHALISAPYARLSQSVALNAAGLGALRLSGLVDPQDRFASAVSSRDWAHRIVLAGEAEAYLEDLRQANPKRLKNFRRLRRVLEREVGEVRLAGPDRDPAALETLLAWKRLQIKRTGAHDFLSADWAETLMRRLFETRQDGFEGLMVNLYAGDRLVLSHFGVRQNGWFHPWLAAFDPDFAAYSPGLVHQLEAIAAMPGLGLHTYDLGPGNDEWKHMFTREGAWIGAGLATAPSISGRLARSSNGLWNLASGAPLLRRVRSRLDHIAALELTVGGRLRGLAHAVADIPARQRQHAR